jgi:hypothetical protein
MTLLVFFVARIGVIITSTFSPTFHDRYDLELPACSLGLIWLAESTAGWFFVREKHC